MSAYTSGIATALALFYSSATALHSFAISASQNDNWSTQPVPATSNGLTAYSVLWPNNTTGVNVKTSAGQLYDGALVNAAASFRYVKLYNKATAPLVASDTPVHRIGLPPNSATPFNSTHGLTFSAGIGLVVTGGGGDTAPTAPTANEVIANFGYK